MLALEIEYLTGRSVATKQSRYEQPEWPPHPTRLFSALVCAWGERKPLAAENDPSLAEQSASEHNALTWLESLPAPELRVSGRNVRGTVPVFVPANDSSTPGRWTKLPKPEVLPWHRPRQERFFPSVTPEDRFVYLIWPTASLDQVNVHRPALERLTHNVISIGHSSSLTRVALCTEPPASSHRPANSGEPTEFALRVPSQGRLAELEAAFTASERLDDPGLVRRYTVSESPQAARPVQGVFKEMFVVSLKGPALPLEATLRLTRTVRASLMKHSQQPPCEPLSGHQSDGKQTARPHAAVIPMSFIDSEYGDGDIKGFGLVLPHNLKLLERRQILQALARTKELIIPGFGQWRLFPVTDLDLAKTSLRDGPYTGTCRYWATVTPIILDRFPKRLIHDETREIIALACERIGLPRPIDVSVSEVSVFRGVPPSFAFPTLTLTGKPLMDGHSRSRVTNGNRKQEVRSRLRVHARVEFAVPVRGPLLLGAGRYLGMGTCRAVREKD